MRSNLAGLRTLVLPWGAPSTSPRIVLGPDVPATLTAGTAPTYTWSAAIIYYYSATTYAWSAMGTDTVNSRAVFATGTYDLAHGVQFLTRQEDPGFVANITTYGGNLSNAFFTYLKNTQLTIGDGTGATHSDQAVLWVRQDGELLIDAGADFRSATPLNWSNGGINPDERWNALTFANGFSNRGVGFTAGSYKKVVSPPNGVWIVGELKSGATIASGTIIATLPNNYRPTAEIYLPAINATTRADLAAVLNTAGQLSLFGTWANGDIIDLNAVYPTDAPSG